MALCFGEEDDIVCITDVKLTGENDEALCLGYKITIKHVVGPV